MPDQIADDVINDGSVIFVGEDDRTHASRISNVLGAQFLDADIQQPGKLAIRPGLTVQGTQSGSLPIRALIGARFVTKKLLAVTGADLREWTGSGAWTTVSSTLTSNLPTWMFMLLGATNKAIILNGTDTVKEYDGTTFFSNADGNTDPPRGTIGIFTSTGRVLIVSNGATPPSGAGNFLYYSSTNPTTLAGAFDRAVNNHKLALSSVTGMIEWTSGQVVLFGPEAIIVADITSTTPANWTFTKVSNDIGCVANRSVVQYGEDILFMARDGIRSLIQSIQDKKRGTTLPLSDPIKTDYIDTIIGSALDRTSAFSYDGRCFFSISQTAGKLTHVLVYDRRIAGLDPLNRGGWSVWRMEIESFGELDFSGTNRLYMGSSGTVTKVYSPIGTSDDGTAISFSATTKRYTFGLPDFDKTGSLVEIEAIAGGSGIMKTEANLDNGGFSCIGNLPLTGSVLMLPFVLPAVLSSNTLIRGKFSLTNLGRFRDIAFRMTMPTLDQAITVTRVSAYAFKENLVLSDGSGTNC